MPAEEAEIDPYELLEVTIESSEAEIRRAYRQRSLKVHPDRNPNNPNAAKKFHELTQAYELLLDPLRRLALDAQIKTKQARKARFEKYDVKRRAMQEELDERERAFKKRKMESEKEKAERVREDESIKEEGRRMREEKEADMKRKEEEMLSKGVDGEEEDNDVPPNLGSLDTTIKLKYSLATHPNLTTASSLSKILNQFGQIDESSIVLSLKSSKNKNKSNSVDAKPKYGTALVPFKQIGDAFGAVCSSGRPERGLDGVEIGWAEGKEPEIIKWLRKMGKLGSALDNRNTSAQKHNQEKVNDLVPKSANLSSFESDILSKASKFSTTTSSNSSFPDLSSSKPNPTPSNVPSATVSGLDYETLTLMQMRQAERERLEKEIREQEANE